MLHLVFVCHSNLPGVIGDIHAGDLDIVVADAGDDLDAVEGVGEDDDVAAGGVGDQRDALHRADTEGLVPDIAGPSQYLVALHSHEDVSQSGRDHIYITVVTVSKKMSRTSSSIILSSGVYSTPVTCVS